VTRPPALPVRFADHPGCPSPSTRR
jgi:hypothetical protein